LLHKDCWTIVSYDIQNELVDDCMLSLCLGTIMGGPVYLSQQVKHCCSGIYCNEVQCDRGCMV